MTHTDYRSRLEAIFSRWPDMRRYADTARIDQTYFWRKDDSGRWQKYLCDTVTVTAFDKRSAEGHE
jgi:hypothetical protein